MLGNKVEVKRQAASVPADKNDIDQNSSPFSPLWSFFHQCLRLISKQQELSISLATLVGMPYYRCGQVKWNVSISMD